MQPHRQCGKDIILPFKSVSGTECLGERRLYGAASAELTQQMVSSYSAEVDSAVLLSYAATPVTQSQGTMLKATLHMKT